MLFLHPTSVLRYRPKANFRFQLSTFRFSRTSISYLQAQGANPRPKARADAGHLRSEWIGVFEGPSSSSLGSGLAKTPPARAPGVPAWPASLPLSAQIRAIRGSILSLQGFQHPPGEFQ